MLKPVSGQESHINLLVEHDLKSEHMAWVRRLFIYGNAEPKAPFDSTYKTPCPEEPDTKI